MFLSVYVGGGRVTNHAHSSLFLLAQSHASSPHADDFRVICKVGSGSSPPLSTALCAPCEPPEDLCK